MSQKKSRTTKRTTTPLIRLSESSSSPQTIEKLPLDMLREIFLKLSFEDIIRSCQISKRFNVLCQDDNLWKILTKRDFNKSVKLYKNLSWKENYLLFKPKIVYVVKEVSESTTYPVDNYTIIHGVYSNKKNVRDAIETVLIKSLKSYEELDPHSDIVKNIKKSLRKFKKQKESYETDYEWDDDTSITIETEEYEMDKFIPSLHHP